MVVLSPGDALLLTLLLVCVPLQMWLQHHYSLSSAEARDGQVFAVIREVHKCVLLVQYCCILMKHTVVSQLLGLIKRHLVPIV